MVAGRQRQGHIGATLAAFVACASMCVFRTYATATMLAAPCTEKALSQQCFTLSVGLICQFTLGACFLLTFLSLPNVFNLTCFPVGAVLTRRMCETAACPAAAPESAGPSQKLKSSPLQVAGITQQVHKSRHNERSQSCQLGKCR